MGDNGALASKLTPPTTRHWIAGELDKLALIAIEFPGLRRWSRGSHHYRCASAIAAIGELRAVGDAARPDLLMSPASPHLRCDDQNVEKALAFNDFSAYYQHAADRL